MRHLLTTVLIVCASATSAQAEPADPLLLSDLNLDVMQGGAAWLVGDHVKARRHFRAAAQRGDHLGQYNLAMMLLHQEGGPCGAAEAMALLHKAADGGVGLAREAMERVDVSASPSRDVKRPFPCALPTPARPMTMHPSSLPVPMWK
jgi:hypothetical protein